MALEKEQIPQYVNAAPLLILSTVDAANAPATRVLASFASDDGYVVYFSTGRSSEKVGQIAGNPSVSALFQHDGQPIGAFRNVEIRGVAVPLADGAEREKAIRLISARNPRFKERAEKGQLGENALYRVTPKAVKVIDFTKGVGPAAVTSFTP
ncbi:MAG TPA: pyridoxamine 5'-phosphate oxidase family protein [Anaeromyxobacteraceae bacterium]|nr:pyridoxamine 5'-phosphate oxidase family protein [Anaeromyxobacteraceae bacterium]